MKLNDIRPSIETSGELEEKFFSIQDQGMIFDILRNKMYSNPILAICREISCNARDAHREVMAAEVPVHIHIPNNLEPFFKIKDFGPGISPDRIANIFIKYAASTKRNDNIQTGGFGLGGKTPFSYSDTFTIITNYNGKQYNYVCFIDETKVGKLALLSESPTKESNGTEIIIPVKPNDFRFFAEWTEHATRHWEVKPIIKGGQITWKNSKKIIDGSDWNMSATNDYNRSIKAIVDGIEYPLELNAFKTYADSADMKMIDAARGDLFLYFGIGELSLSASREQIYLDKPTQYKIRLKLNNVIKEIKQRVIDKINSFPNLWEANIYYHKDLYQAFHSLEFLGPLRWKNYVLNNRRVDTSCPIFYFIKGKHSHRHGTDPNKLTRSETYHLLFDENSSLFVNDLLLKEPTPRHVKKAFEDNPTLKSLQVVCPTDKITLDKLNQAIHLDEMAPKLLSSITKASARAYTPASSRLLIFKFDPSACNFRQVSYSSIEEDNNKKILCLLDKGHNNIRQVIIANKIRENFSPIKTLWKKFPQISFYGIDRDTLPNRIKEEFSDFQKIEEFITKNVVDNKSINYIEIKYAVNHAYDLDEKLIKIIDKIKPMILDSKSLFMKCIDLHQKIKNLFAKKESDLLFLYELMAGEISENDLEIFIKNNPDNDIVKINSLYKQKYPLLRYVDHYYNDNGKIIDHIAHYINLIDKEK